MSAWKSGFAIWWNRRRRFIEEWAFHRDAAISELEGIGYTRRRARKAAKRKMGGRLRHRRQALAAIGGDLNGLWRLLPIQSITRSPVFVPVALIFVAALELIVSPARSMAVQCVKALLFCGDLPAVERVIPLTPGGAVPVELAGALLRALAAAGIVRVATNLLPRRSLRSCLYAATVLCGIVLAGAVSWVLGIQILASRSWGHDGLQGLSLLGFLFGFIAMLYVAMSRWWIDAESRCPDCLRLPGMPESRGKPHDVLLEPREIESICFRGHGVLLQSRWSRRFQAGEPLFPVPGSANREG
jgi:hypothetical protein